MNLGTQWDLAEVSLQVGYHGIYVGSNITCVRIEGIIIMDLWITENSWKNILNHNLRLLEILALYDFIKWTKQMEPYGPLTAINLLLVSIITTHMTLGSQTV